MTHFPEPPAAKRLNVRRETIYEDVGKELLAAGHPLGNHTGALHETPRPREARSS